MTAEASLAGLSPSLVTGVSAPRPITDRERAKYDAIWGFEQYHAVSPGLNLVEMFWSIARPKPGEVLVDVGAGSGAASRALQDRGLSVTAFDFTSEAWAHKDITLHTGSIWRELTNLNGAKYVYCCDVMEHIPPELTGLCISNILRICEKAFFSVSFVPDVMGAKIGETLHLTVKPYLWWLDLFRELGTVIEARDLLTDGVFYVSK